MPTTTDRKPCPNTTATAALAADPAAMRYARGLARRLAGGQARLVAEFTSAALAGLTRAAARWRPERGVPFEKYARHRIIGSILEARREARPKGYRRTGDLPLVESLSELTEPAAPGSEVGWEAESLDTLESLTCNLPAKERELLRLYFGHAGMTLREIGVRLGVGESRASQIRKEAIERLRRQAGCGGGQP